MSRPLVSVIIPTYNRNGLIGLTLDSVARQTFRDYEVIIIDDGSTDGTSESVSRRPEPIRYLRQEHRGVAAARNRAMEEASAPLVAFLDSDDVWLPDFLAEVTTALTTHPEAAMAYSNFRTVDAHGQKLRGHRKAQHGGAVTAPLFSSIFIHTSCVVARRDLILEAGGFDEGMTANEDYDLWLRLSLTYPFVSLSKSLCLRRSHNGSLSRNGSVRNLITKARLLEEFYERHGNGTVPADLARNRLAKTYYTAGMASTRSRNFTDSVDLLGRSLFYLSSARAWPWYLLSVALRGTPADKGRRNGHAQDDELD
jgi:glycosyltransferase involved in cell wall biosynthesis